MGRKSDVAFGSEFSPEQVDLTEVLELAKRHEHDSAAFLRAVIARWYPDPEVAKNLPLSLKAYGLIAEGSGPDDKDKPKAKRTRYHLTDTAKRLLVLKDKLEEQHTDFARHILVNVQGAMAVVAVLEDLAASGEDVSMGSVRRELVKRGLHIPKNSMSPTRIRQWLERAGLVTDEPYRVVEERKQELLGLSTPELEALSGLSKAQRAFARAFARLNLDEASSNRVRDYATLLFKVDFPDTGLPGAVLEPLRQRGLLEYEKTTGGRGGKPPIVRPTKKLRNELFEPLLDQIEKSAGPDYRRFVRMPWAEVLRDVESEDKNVKGKALEAMAAKLAFLLDLDFRSWRLRGPDTGGAEVDLVVESVDPVFLRWNIQCKNTSKVRLDDVAKEVGIAVEMASSVILMVSRGKFSADAIEHAKHVMARTNLTVILISRTDIDVLSKEPAQITQILRRASELARSIKAPKVEDND